MDGMKKKAFLLLTMFLTAVFVLSGGIGGTYAEASETSAAEISGTLVRESDGHYYYYIDGVKQTGWQTITQDGVENTYYFFGTAGSQPAGSAAVGLQLIGSYRYYFSNEGVMQTGWQTI
ncbi:MAG: hypothetical protein LUI39_08420, partial [Lachnospiraceae bacterium]|nr:hypothetical protein [Lachnospiraceae bacterium]